MAHGLMKSESYITFPLYLTENILTFDGMILKVLKTVSISYHYDMMQELIIRE